MAPMRRNLSLPRWLAGALVVNLAGFGLAACGSAIATEGEGVAALAGVASTQTPSQSGTAVVAANGFGPETIATIAACSPSLHCAP
jgi:hypothetical protein